MKGYDAEPTLRGIGRESLVFTVCSTKIHHAALTGTSLYERFAQPWALQVFRQSSRLASRKHPTTETGSLKRGLVNVLAATGAQLLIASVMVLLAGSVDWESFFCMDHVWIGGLLGCCADGES